MADAAVLPHFSAIDPSIGRCGKLSASIKQQQNPYELKKLNGLRTRRGELVITALMLFELKI